MDPGVGLGATLGLPTSDAHTRDQAVTKPRSDWASTVGDSGAADDDSGADSTAEGFTATGSRTSAQAWSARSWSFGALLSVVLGGHGV